MIMKNSNSANIDTGIGLRIRARRITVGLSQGALAGMIGVTFQQIQKYERGKNRVAGSRLVQIAKALEITVTELIGDETVVSSRDDPCSVLSQSKSGQELARAFIAIKNEQSKRLVIDLAKRLGGAHEGNPD